MLTWPPNAATVLLFWPILTAVISLFYNYLDGIPRVHAVLALMVKAGLDLPGILDALKRLLTGQSVAAQKAAKAVAAIAVLACLSATQSACLAAAPIVPVTPTNTAQVSACEGTASQHNDLVVAGFVLSGGATGLGAVAAIDQNTGDRTGYAIAGAITGAVAAVDVAWTALTSSQFANSQCSSVVGNLAAHPPVAP